MSGIETRNLSWLRGSKSTIIERRHPEAYTQEAEGVFVSALLPRLFIS